MAARFHHRRNWILSCALVCAGLPSFAPAQTPNYVGAAKCKECHADTYAAFDSTPHRKIALGRQPVGEGNACEGCHGPGREHAQTGDPTKIFSFRSVAAKDVASHCLACHQYGQEHSNFLRSAHKTSDVSRIDCHSAHHSVTTEFILRKPQPQLCYGCHQEIAAEFAQPFHHRVDEKLLTCTDCHNQHGGVLRAQLRTTASRDAICLKCHAEKSGPFVFEHAPQRTEGCVSCHVPHGSANPRLLKRSEVNLLCLECHTVAFGSIVRDAPGFHDQAAQFQACTLCHEAIHGSNFNRMFLK